MICDYCDKTGIKSEDLTEVNGGDKVCPECLNDYYFKCKDCGNYYLNDNRFSNDNGDYFCAGCFNDTYFYCARCSNVYRRDDASEDSYGDLYCSECWEEMDNEDNEEEDDCERQADENTTKFQSKSKGKIIESTRTFGVELEVLGHSSEVRESLDDAFGLVGDSSIEDDGEYNGGFELVSPVLSGGAGEKAIINACKILNDNDIGLNQTCGMHVHLGAEDFLSLREIDYHTSLFQDEDYKNKDYYKYFIPRKVYDDNVGRNNPKEFIEHNLENGCFRKGDNTAEGFDIKARFYKIHNFFDDLERGEKVFKPKKGDIVVYTKKKCQGNITILKNLLLFYIAFEPILFATQPKSRREGNTYTQSLQKSFSFQDIRSIQKESDFEKYWYKNTRKRDVSRMKNNHYHDSRYYTVNFHALFETRKGNQTLEIRVHAGTKNATKVLNWVALHQTILDKIKSTKIDAYNIEKAQNIFLLSEKMDYFLSLLELKPELEEYLRKRMIFHTPTLQINKNQKGSEGQDDSENN